MELVGALICLGGGFLMVAWMTEVIAPRSMPDLLIVTEISATTSVTLLGLAALAIAAAPLPGAHKLRRMDIPSTLRVLE